MFVCHLQPLGDERSTDGSSMRLFRYTQEYRGWTSRPSGEAEEDTMWQGGLPTKHEKIASRSFFKVTTTTHLWGSNKAKSPHHPIPRIHAWEYIYDVPSIRPRN